MGSKEYAKIVEGWIKGEIAQGATLEEAYWLVFYEIYRYGRFFNGLIKLKPRLEPESKVAEPFDTFKEYVKTHGFQHEGEWYFRTTWLGNFVLRYLEEEGFITRAGTSSDLHTSGIQVPEAFYGTRHRPVVFYKLNRDRLQIPA